nr:hypothetical protein [Agromyces sp. LHK192]
MVRGDETGDARADHGDALALGADGRDLVGGAEPRGERAVQRSGRVDRTGLTREPDAVGDGGRELLARLGVVPIASKLKAPRAKGSRAQRDRRIAVGAGTPGGRVGSTVGVGVGVGLGVAVRVGVGSPQVQLARPTVATPAIAAARKPRRGMPRAPCESMRSG